MSDDLVKRLECYADLNDAVFHPWVYGEAADRIKKLESALREIVEQEPQTAHPVVVHIIKIARKALEQTNG